jgi:hypothetical protein
MHIVLSAVTVVVVVCCAATLLFPAVMGNFGSHVARGGSAVLGDVALMDAKVRAVMID